MNDKEKLEHMINFRATEKMYESLMGYLKQTGISISGFMRQATYDYLRLKEMIKKNGYGTIEPPKEKEKAKVNADMLYQNQANKFCDGDSCEIIPIALEIINKPKAVDKHD